MARMTAAMVPIFVLVALAALSSAAPDRVVRVELKKNTAEHGGFLEQPLTSYYVRTEIGTPPKPFNMLLDINGREVWLPHHSRMGLVYLRLNYKNGYRKQNSTTGLKEPNEIYKISHEGIALEGKAYRDLVSLVDVVESLQPAKFEQRFLAMSSASSDKFSRFGAADGVLAFSPWPISETGSDLVCVAMHRAKLIGELKFGLLLDADSGGDYGGELTLGGANTLKFGPSPREHRLVSQHSWEIQLDKVMVGANLLDACPGTDAARSPCRAVLSTVHNGISGPEEAIRSLLVSIGIEEAKHNFKFSELYEMDCLKAGFAPPLTFIIDGAHYTVPPLSYIKRKTDGLIFKTTTCYVELHPSMSADSWTIGTSFLSNFYTVFDMKSRTVAFGQKR